MINDIIQLDIPSQKGPSLHIYQHPNTDLASLWMLRILIKLGGWRQLFKTSLKIKESVSLITLYLQNGTDLFSTDKPVAVSVDVNGSFWMVSARDVC